MKTVFLRLMAVVATVVGLVWLAGYLLPRSYSIQSSIEIAAEPETVFSMINELPKWKDWSPWGQQKDLEIRYSGEPKGIGAIQTWSDPRGNGKLWITDSQINEFVTYRMYSGGFPELESRIRLKSVDGITTVTWSSEGVLPRGAFYGYFARLFEPGMQAEYDQGLARLKSVVESRVQR